MARNVAEKTNKHKSEDRCPCEENKICHKDIGSAEHHLELYSEEVVIHTLERYPCKEAHGCWHLGHGQTKEKRSANYRLMHWWRFI